MDSHETWAPAVGGGGKRRRCPPPLKNQENKGFATYSSLWGALSPCEGISATFFHLWRLFFDMWGLFLLLFSPYGRPF